MAWWVPAAMIAASLAGSLLSNSGGGETAATPKNTYNSGLAWMSQLVEDVARQQIADERGPTGLFGGKGVYPKDYRIKVGGQEFPIDMEAFRRRVAINSVAPALGPISANTAVQQTGPVATQGNAFDRILPLAAVMASTMGGGSSGSGSSKGGSFFS
jgi:hypothetical protein